MAVDCGLITKKPRGSYAKVAALTVFLGVLTLAADVSVMWLLLGSHVVLTRS